jgi:hypothetical protein
MASSSSAINIVTFLLTTLLYYLVIKPVITYDILVDPEKHKQFVSSSYTNLGIYVLLIIVSQYLVNVSMITTTCGGSVTENLGSAAFLTFIPWSLMFGVLIIVLTMYPGFKTAFSDVIGYFYVSSSANKVLTELLVDRDLQDTMDKDSTSTPEQKKALQDAADTIIKICGNTSILINQIVPSNFVEYWNILKPLMKTEFQKDTPESHAKQKQLFELVVTRDNVGEAMWFIYTGILVTSLIQLKIATRGCVSSPATMEKNYQQFLDQQEHADAQQKQATSTVYTVTA